MAEHHVTERVVDLTKSPVQVHTGAPVYESIRAQLAAAGWVQGRTRDRRGRLDLLGAIEVAVEADPDVGEAPGRHGPALARAGRIRRHLRGLAGTANLAAWNDAPGRGLEDLWQLLEDAALAYPDD